MYVEDFEIYLNVKRQKKISVRIASNETSQDTAKKIAHQIGLQSISDHLEIAEDQLGKERSLKPEETLFDAKTNWKNDNPTYFKFLLRLKRGAPESAQMQVK